jgi:hypothetical protein
LVASSMYSKEETIGGKLIIRTWIIG